MIQAAKRKARGFHTFEGYSAMIFLVAGKLKLSTPVYRSSVNNLEQLLNFFRGIYRRNPMMPN
jgi:hypothetical protein